MNTIQTWNTYGTIAGRICKSRYRIRYVREKDVERLYIDPHARRWWLAKLIICLIGRQAGGEETSMVCKHCGIEHDRKECCPNGKWSEEIRKLHVELDLRVKSQNSELANDLNALQSWLRGTIQERNAAIAARDAYWYENARLQNHCRTLIEEMALRDKERNEARSALAKAMRLMGDMVELIESACPSSSAWIEDNPKYQPDLATRYDNLCDDPTCKAAISDWQ